jgi:hypothetical protein
MYFERVASTWMWRRKCGAERESEWGKEEQKGRASKKARKHLRCPQIRIRFRILDFVASSLTNMSFRALRTTTAMASLPAHLSRPSLDQD